MKLKYRISRFVDDVKHLPYRIKYGIENLIKWFPIIWKDRHWDHSFFFLMLRFKLIQMEKGIRKYGIHVNAERDADNMQKCIWTLDRIIEDVYHDIAYKRHDEIWGDAKFSWLELEDNKDFCELNITRPNVKNEKDEARETKNFRRCMELQTYLEEQDLNYLFSMIRKHIRSWWD